VQEDGILMHRGKIYLSNSGEIKNTVLREMKIVPYVGHLGYPKTIATMGSH
jgi:hypothetical protein